MDKYRVSAYQFEYYEGHRILECVAFSIDPLDTLEEVVSWIRSLDFKPDHIRVNYMDSCCLFDNEDTRILNNVFYCRSHDEPRLETSQV